MRTKITLGALLAGLSAVCLHSQISTEGDVSRAVTNTSSITVTGVFEIGRTAAGTLSVLEGGTLTSSTLSVGSNVGGLGSVNLSGGTLDIYYSLRLGSGGTGMMTFSSGTLNIGETLTMSAVNNGRSTFYMTGGRLTAQDAFITQGAGGNNSAATLSFLGGTAIFSSEIRFGNGTSSMLVDGGDVITGRLHGAFSGGTATLTLNSGSITLTDSSRQTNIGYSGSMALYVNGGSLVQNQSAYFVLGTTSATLTGTGTARFSSKADEITLGNVYVSSKGQMIVALEGADFSGPVVTLAGLGKQSGARFKLELDNYTATENKVVELIRGGTASAYEDIVWEITGLGEYYELVGDGPYFENGSLSLGINYIPESAASADLLGLAALLFVRRRRDKESVRLRR